MRDQDYAPAEASSLLWLVYDMEHDPLEMHNLAAQKPEVVARLKQTATFSRVLRKFLPR